MAFAARVRQSTPAIDPAPAEAIDLVLQSGRPSAEHVLNVLARLAEGPPPERVDTALVIVDEPIADSGRYDRRREEVSHG